MSPPLSVVEFANQVPPAHTQTRGRLQAHAEALAYLKAQGYSLAQMREFLLTQGVAVSRAAISAYFNRQAAA